MGARKPGLLKEAIDGAAKAVLIRALAGTSGDVAKAARNVGVHRTHFYTLMKRYGITLERQVVRVALVERKP